MKTLTLLLLLTLLYGCDKYQYIAPKPYITGLLYDGHLIRIDYVFDETIMPQPRTSGYFWGLEEDFKDSQPFILDAENITTPSPLLSANIVLPVYGKNMMIRVWGENSHGIGYSDIIYFRVYLYDTNIYYYNAKQTGENRETLE